MVKESLEKMRETYRNEYDANLKAKDECHELLHKLEIDQITSAGDLKLVNSTVQALTQTVTKLDNALASLKAQIVESRTRMQSDNEQAKQRNLEFQKTWADHTLTLSILQKAEIR